MEILMSIHTRRSFVSALGTLATRALFAPQRLIRSVAAATPPSAVILWNQAALEAIRTTRMNPPVAARALAILHTCIYDAWAIHEERARPTEQTSRRCALEHRPARQHEAVSFAAHRALLELFPSEQAAFDDLLGRLGHRVSRLELDSAGNIGRTAADTVLFRRRTDGANQLGDLAAGAYADYTNYQPVNSPDGLVDPNHWQPLRLSDGKGGTFVQKFIVPHWYRVKPFALISASQFRPPAPYRKGSVEYRRQAEEIIQMVAGLSNREKLICEYWIDGSGSETPPGHWCLLAQQVAARDSHTLAADVKMFFILTNALLDTSIAVWDAKRTYDAVRPYTAIRHLFANEQIPVWVGPGRGVQVMAGSEWIPYQQASALSPPHPEYVSGHSAFSAAAATILRRFTGSDNFGASHTQAPGTCKIEPGLVPVRELTLRWSTFTAAADEAGLSRRLGGIHFKAADFEGRRLGQAVAEQVWSKVIAYISGA
jgi:hypothetical protein